MSLGDVIDRGFYIEPDYTVESGKLQSDDIASLLELNIVRSILENDSILVHGEAGYGKTTILAKSFLVHSSLVSKHPDKIPFYLQLKSKTHDYSFNIQEFVDDYLANMMNRHPYPLMTFNNIYIYFYLDGFDELSEELTGEELEKIMGSEIFKKPKLLTCRERYLQSYLFANSFADSFDTKVKVNPWSIDVAKKYVAKFYSIHNINPAEKEKIHSSLFENPQIKDLLESPLMVTLFLYAIENNNYALDKEIRTTIDLFNSSVKGLAARECANDSSASLSAVDLESIWRYTAWYIYKQKNDGKSAVLDELHSFLKKHTQIEIKTFSASLFDVLFDINNNELIGTFHQQFFFYLLATMMVSSVTEEEYPFPDFLELVMPPETNRFFRSIWNKRPATDVPEKIFTRFKQTYYSALENDSQVNLYRRVHSVYHILRYQTNSSQGPTVKEFADRAFVLEPHASVKLSLYFGVIKLGDFEREEEFYKLLSNKKCKFGDYNRGYHLAYYSDSSKLHNGKLPFKDEPCIDWIGTLGALNRHFTSEKKQHYYLLRIDIVTMLALINEREKTHPLTAEDITRMDQLLKENNNQHKNPEFHSKVMESFELLKKVVNEYEVQND